MTERAQNADLRRKPQIFTDSPLLLEIQACGGRRKPQKTADFRRKPKIFAENRRKPQIGLRHLRCVTFSSALWKGGSVSQLRYRESTHKARTAKLRIWTLLIWGVFRVQDSVLRERCFVERRHARSLSYLYGCGQCSWGWQSFVRGVCILDLNPPPQHQQWKQPLGTAQCDNRGRCSSQGRPKVNHNHIVQQYFALDVALKRHLMARHMKNLCVFSVFHCVEGAFDAAFRHTSKLEWGAARWTQKWLWSWLGCPLSSDPQKRPKRLVSLRQRHSVPTAGFLQGWAMTFLEVVFEILLQRPVSKNGPEA